MPRGYYASRDTLFNRCAPCSGPPSTVKTGSAREDGLETCCIQADSLLCCVTSELQGAYAYGLAGTMVWEIWPVFGDDGGYECVFAPICRCRFQATSL